MGISDYDEEYVERLAQEKVIEAEVAEPVVYEYQAVFTVKSRTPLSRGPGSYGFCQLHLKSEGGLTGSTTSTFNIDEFKLVPVVKEN